MDENLVVIASEVCVSYVDERPVNNLIILSV